MENCQICGSNSNVNKRMSLVNVKKSYFICEKCYNRNIEPWDKLVVEMRVYGEDSICARWCGDVIERTCKYYGKKVGSFWSEVESSFDVTAGDIADGFLKEIKKRNQFGNVITKNDLVNWLYLDGKMYRDKIRHALDYLKKWGILKLEEGNKYQVCMLKNEF